MTIRQFAYLAGGSILAWVFFSLPFPAFVKFPLAFFFAFLGVALAFLPIEQRPMDVMLRNFIRALFNPNQYVFQKKGGTLIVQTHALPKKQDQKQVQSLPREKLEKYLKTIPKPKNKIDDKEANFLGSLSKMIKGGSLLLQNAPSSAPSSPLPNTPPRIITIEEDRKKEKPQVVDAEEVKNPTEKKEQPVKPVLPPAPQPAPRIITSEEVHQKALDLQEQLNQALLAKQKLEQDLFSMQRKFEEHKKNVLTPSNAPVSTPTLNVRNIPLGMEKNAGLPMTPIAPNLITGIVKDPRGNVLSNILVEIKDQDGNPVRAFKTNALGQFAAVTPLLNGAYAVSFEDPGGKNQFDAVEIEAQGQLITPLEVISTDQREQLRKELFG